jgi:hypothetical protein
MCISEEDGVVREMVVNGGEGVGVKVMRVAARRESEWSENTANICRGQWKAKGATARHTTVAMVNIVCGRLLFKQKTVQSRM